MISTDAKLALTEYLLSSDDVSACGREGLDWLGRHAGVTRALAAAAAADPKRLWGVASLGISTARTGEFTLNLADRKQPLVVAAWGIEAVHFPPGRRQPETPLEGAGFFAIPLHPFAKSPPVGLLLIESEQPVLDPGILWCTEVLAEKLQRLHVRSGDTATGVDRERQLLYSIINAVTDPILLTDTAGKLLVGNTSAEDLFAARDDESEGRRRAVELNNLFFTSALAAQLVGPEAGSGREVILVSPDDGSDLLFELLASPLPLQRDETSVVSVLRNVTDLSHARQELEDNYQRLRVAEAQVRADRNRLDLIVASVADPIIVTDPSGDILMTNAHAERFFTAPPDAGQRAQRHVRSNVAQFSSFIAGLLLSGTSDRARARTTLTDPETGRVVPLEAIVGAMRAGPSELTGVVTALHDQTEAIERERLYAELQKASAQLEVKVREATTELAQQNELLRRQALALEQGSAAKSQFLANVSHEFRTPLNAILGYTFMLLEKAYGDLQPEQVRTVSRIDANSRHLATLINDVLDIERIEAGRMPLQITTFAVEELVREVLEELAGVIAQSPAAVRVAGDLSMPRIRSDRQKLKQILVNLLGNALKFTREGHVDIVVRRNERKNRFTAVVRDTGIGIALTDYDRIFEPFQQAGRAGSRVLGGTGLGLAICRRLARMLGGDISVHSEVGVGSAFEVDLPVRVRVRGRATTLAPVVTRRSA